MNIRYSRARLVAVLAVAAAGIAVACVDGSIAPGSDDAAMTRVGSFGVGNAVPRLSAAQKERFDSYKASMQWVGVAHHEGMKVIIAHLRQAKHQKRSALARQQARCRALGGAAVATLRVIDRHQGVSRSDGDRAAVVQGFPELSRCPQPLSLFRNSAPALPMPLQEAEPEITGAYEAYVDPLELAINSSTGSVASVQAAVDPIIAQAILDGIPEGDILALAAMGSLAVSSAVEWNSFDWTLLGGGGEPCDSIGCNMMSVFPQDSWDGRVLKVVSADAGGCLAGVKKWAELKALLLLPAPKALAGVCGVRGAIGSGLAILAMS